jgi:hypothetical protein
MEPQQDSQFLQFKSISQSKTGVFAFCGPSYSLANFSDQNAESLWNMYVEADESGHGKSPFSLQGTPGLSLFSQLPPGPIRGMYAGENRLFVVSGPNLYEVFKDGSNFNRSATGNTLLDDGNPVYMSANGTGTQLCIAASGTGSTQNYTDLAISAGSDLVISSAGHPFSALLDAGQTLVIASGTGFIPGSYTIVSVDGSGNATLSSSPGSTSSTGGVGSLTILAFGYLYCDEGLGPIPQRFSVAYTDLAIDPTTDTIVSSAAQPFSAATDDGYTLVITGGPGFTPGTYTIESVDSMGNATLSSAAGSVSSVAGTGIEYLSYVPAVQLAYLDTFFIAQASYSSRIFYLSASDDGTMWDALQFGSKESYPDNISGILTDHEELWLFGSEQSIEGWHNAGAAPFPFVRDDNAAMHYGTEAPFSPMRFMLGFAWLAKDQVRGGRQAMYAQGWVPQRISNHAVESIWNTYPIVSDCIAYSYEENGHPFYVLNFASANATWVYDGITQMWHQRAYFGGAATSGGVVSFSINAAGSGYVPITGAIASLAIAVPGTGYVAGAGALLAVVIDSTGSGGYLAGDIVGLGAPGSGGTVEILTVDGGGHALTIAIVTPGGGYATALNQPALGGSGVGLTISISTVSSGADVVDLFGAVPGGGTIQVTGVTAMGAVTSVSIVDNGAGYSIASGLPAVGGHGHGLVLNITSVSNTYPQITIQQTGSADNCVLQINAVNGAGGVTSASIVNPGSAYVVAPNLVTTGGSPGTGAKINITAVSSSGAGANQRQRQSFHAYVNLGAGDSHFVGDWQLGQIYQQSLSTYTDNGATIQRIRIAPHISTENTLQFYHRFRLDLETGNGAMSQIYLDWSSDGGHTFGQYGSAPGTLPSLGLPGNGQYQFSVDWLPLGSDGTRTFKVTILDPVRIAIVNAYLDVTSGTVPAGTPGL